MPHPAPKLRLNHRGHFVDGSGGGRLRVSESRRMVKQHGPGGGLKSPIVVRKYTPLEQNLKGDRKAYGARAKSLI